MAAASAFSALPEILQPKEEDIQMMLSAGGMFSRSMIVDLLFVPHRVYLTVLLFLSFIQFTPERETLIPKWRNTSGAAVVTVFIF